MNHFTEAIGLSRYTLYMQDYGGPAGFRMALAPLLGALVPVKKGDQMAFTYVPGTGTTVAITG